MARFILFVVLVGIHVYTFLDIVRSPSASVRTLPRSLWLFVSLIPFLGPIAWLLGGRPLVDGGPNGGSGGSGGSGGIQGGPRPGRGPLAPDDDPAFLKRLEEQAWAAKMERLRRERQTGPGPDKQPGGGPLPDSSDPGAGDDV
jgi:hypothetical protein